MKINFIVLVIFAGSTTLTAQGLSEEVYPKQVSIEHNDAVRQFSRFFVTDLMNQGGITPQASDFLGDAVQLTNVSLIGNGNAAVINQLGMLNVINLGVEGNNNRFNINQIGSNSLANLSLTGSNNEFRLLQNGDGNIYIGMFNIDGFNGDNSILRIQEGDGNFIQELGVGSVPLGLEIIQTGGNSIPLIIEHNN